MYIIYVINSKPPIQEARYKIKHVQRTATTTSKETENHEVTKPNANTTPTNHRTNKRAQKSHQRNGTQIYQQKNPRTRNRNHARTRGRRKYNANKMKTNIKYTNANTQASDKVNERQKK